ncbi:MAG: hypothetical protein AAGD32_00340 [Planctomycetota bacterium]
MRSHALRTSLKSAKLALAAAAVTLFMGAGCDDPDSPENKIKAGLANASGSLAAENYDALRADLTGLTSTGGSPTELANTYDLLAQVELASARAIRNDANAKLVDVEKRLQDLAGVSSNLADVNRRIAALRSADPGPALQAIDDTVAGLRGAGNAETFTIGDVDIETVGTLEQEVSRLQGEVANLEAQRQQLETTRLAALKRASELFSQADSESGDAGMDTFRNAIVAQKEASNTATQQSQLDVELLAVRGDLEVAQAKLESLAKGVENIEGLKAATETHWETLQNQIAVQQQRAEAKKAEADALISGGDGESLGEALAQAQSQVEAAKTAFAAAVQRFSEGASQANSAGRDSAAPPKAYFDLSTGAAQREQGELLMSVATSAYLREIIARSAENSGVTLPDALSSSASAADLDANAEAARAILASAEQSFLDASNGGGTLGAEARAAVSDAAAFLTGFTRFSLSQVALLTGNDTEAEQALKSAVDAVSELDDAEFYPLPVAMRDLLNGVSRSMPADAPSDEESPAEVESMDESEESPADDEMSETPDASEAGDAKAMEK